MSRGSVAGNSVMKAVEDLCGLYEVPVLRMQSRMFTVAGVGGRERPFFVGEWRDRFGEMHRKGMADLLLQPRVRLANVMGDKSYGNAMIAFPLWVECKAGSGKPTVDQLAFAAWTHHIGAGYLCVTDSCESLMEWFKKYRVERP